MGCFHVISETRLRIADRQRRANIYKWSRLKISKLIFFPSLQNWKWKMVCGCHPANISIQNFKQCYLPVTKFFIEMILVLHQHVFVLSKFSINNRIWYHRRYRKRLFSKIGVLKNTTIFSWKGLDDDDLNKIESIYEEK